MDFLYEENPRADDVVAEDLMAPGTNWLEIRLPSTQRLKVARKRAGKEIAHLTYARLEVTADTNPWAYLDIEQDVSAAFRVFLEHVPPEKRSVEWRNGVPA